MTLVVRREPDGLRRYVHIGTGNYNASTARIYEDLGLFTADEEIAADVADLFNYVTGFGRPQRFRKPLVAPFMMRSRLVEHIRGVRAAAADGKTARIRLKLNALVDPTIIEELYAASAAGAEIDIQARSICMLRPGVKGLSESIRVRSIVGRFLEHSRVYWFDAGDTTAVYLGSADLMPRNLDRRIEVLTPVENVRARAELAAILDSALADTTNSWSSAPTAPGSASRGRARKPHPPGRDDAPRAAPRPEGALVARGHPFAACRRGRRGMPAREGECGAPSLTPAARGPRGARAGGPTRREQRGSRATDAARTGWVRAPARSLPRGGGEDRSPPQPSPESNAPPTNSTLRSHCAGSRGRDRADPAESAAVEARTAGALFGSRGRSAGLREGLPCRPVGPRWLRRPGRAATRLAEDRSPSSRRARPRLRRRLPAAPVLAHAPS